MGGSYTTNGSWWPSLTIYHGAVVAIAWPGTTLPGSDSGLLSGQIGGPPPSSQISVAVGSTLAEAMGAMIAKTNNASNAADQARVLEAFMSGALAELDLADGAARVDVRLHADSFGSAPGQETTEDISQPPFLRPSLPAAPSSINPGIFSGEVSAVPTTTPARSPITNLVSSTVETQKFVAPELFSERFILAGNLSSALGVLPKPPLPPPAPSQTITVKRTAPRFFFPSDRFFLVQNADRSYKHGYDGRFSEDNKLICRLTGFAITELSCTDTVNANARYAVVETTSSSVAWRTAAFLPNVKSCCENWFCWTLDRRMLRRRSAPRQIRISILAFRICRSSRRPGGRPETCGSIRLR